MKYKCNDCGSTNVEELDDYQEMVDDLISWFKYEEALSNHNDDMGGPCYANHLCNTEGVLNAIKKVTATDVLKVAMDHCFDKATVGILTLSVTSKESHYKDYLDAVAMYPGANVTPVNKGSYTCYYIVIPAQPELP